MSFYHNLHYGNFFLSAVITLMLNFFILNINNLKNTVSVFNKSRYSFVSYLENTFAILIGEGNTFQNTA